MHRFIGRMAPLAAVAAALVTLAEASCAAKDASCAVRGDSLLQVRHGTVKDMVDEEPLAEEEGLGDPLAGASDGFDVHLFNSWHAARRNDSLVRPLFRKTFRCKRSSQSSCEECFGGDGCIDVRSRRRGVEYLYVAATPGWRYHRIRASFRCPERASFTIISRVLVSESRGRVEMKVDGKPANASVTGWRRFGHGHVLSFRKTWDSRERRILEVDLIVRLVGKAFAVVSELVVHLSRAYLICEDLQTCLSELADSDQGLELRNSNEQQLMCLNGDLPDNAACVAWKACLDTVSINQTQRIRTLLLAAGVQGGGGNLLSLAGTAGTGLGRGWREPVPEDSCIDPRIDDPESWLCSCLDQMEETCLTMSSAFLPSDWSKQKCLTAQMCEDPFGQVCTDWKEDVGCDGAEYEPFRLALRNYFPNATTGSDNSTNGSTLLSVDGPGGSPVAMEVDAAGAEVAAATVGAGAAAPVPQALLARGGRGGTGAAAGGRTGAVLDASVGGKATACT